MYICTNLKNYIMKTILITILMMLSVSVYAITSTTSGKWAQTSTWDLNRAPINGDTINISVGDIVTLNQDVVLNNVIINVYGELGFNGNNKSLTVDVNSSIILHPGGIIVSTNSNNPIMIGDDIVFIGDDTLTTFNVRVLPITLIGIAIERDGTLVILEWFTASELNNDHFIVSKSVDGENWSLVTNVNGSGTTSQINTYRIIFDSPGATYIKLEQVDYDGSKTELDIIYIATQVRRKIRNVYNMNGQVVSKDLNQLGHGIYIIEYDNNDIIKIIL